MSDDIRIEYVPLSTIARWPRNPKLHDHDALGASIERFGFVQPLLIDERTGQLVAGHGRLETLQKRRAAGEQPPGRVRADGSDWFVPVVRGVSFKDESEAEAYLLADNRLVEAGGWDDAALSEIFAGLGEVADLSGTGFTQHDVDRLLRALPPPATAEFKEFGAVGESTSVLAGAAKPAEVAPRAVTCPKCGHGFKVA